MFFQHLKLVNSTEITADKAEEILADRIREYGPKLLEEWAKKKEFTAVKNILEENPQAKFQETKELYWHTTFGDVSMSERTFIINGKLVRPFSNSANVVCRSYSPLLQRRITDFGSDVSFGKAVEKMNEHYGIVIPESSIRLITQKHGENLFEISQKNSLDNKMRKRSTWCA